VQIQPPGCSSHRVGQPALTAIDEQAIASIIVWTLVIYGRSHNPRDNDLRDASNAIRVGIETRPACRGALPIACIEHPYVIAKILTHLDAKGAEPQAPRRPPCRAPPPPGLFD
jgi:hypothetical protein